MSTDLENASRDMAAHAAEAMMHRLRSAADDIAMLARDLRTPGGRSAGQLAQDVLVSAASTSVSSDLVWQLLSNSRDADEARRQAADVKGSPDAEPPA